MAPVNDIHGLVSNLSNSDKDHRYMATSDLLAALQQPDWRQPSTNEDCNQLCAKVVNQLDDLSGDISALAVKCLVALGNKMGPQHIHKMLEQMCNKIVPQDDAPRKKDHNDSTFIGLKALVTDIPDQHGALVTTSCIPILVKGLDREEAIKSDCLVMLASIFARFGEHVSPAWPVMQKLLRELATGGTATAKKAIPCIPALSVHLDDSKTEELMKELTQCVQTSQSSEAAQTCMQAVAACAKALGFRFGPYVSTVVPLVMERCTAASQQADSTSGAEEKEAALHAVTAVVQYCAEVLKPHMGSVLTLAQAEIAYDPNLADTGDVDMEGSDGDYYDDDDGGEYDDDEYNDDEDTSWKVRRAACLLLVALVAAYPEQAASLYSQCRPTLQARFKEREESVKLDVFVAFSALVRQRGATASDEERAQLATDAAEDTTALVKQLRATRSAKLRTGVFEVFQALLEATAAGGFHAADAVAVCKDVLSDSSSPNPLKIEVLRFASLAFTESSAPELLPHLADLVPCLKRNLQDRYYKVVSEAVGVVERASAAAALSDGAGAHSALFTELFVAVLELLKAKDVDQEVKECSIKCTAVMMSKLPAVLSPETPRALPLICDKLRSEGTRYAAVNACREIAAAQPTLPLAPFVGELVTLTTPFLRKAHRGLRYATLCALASLLGHHSGADAKGLDGPLLEALLTEAAPLICDKDLLLAAAALQLCEAAAKIQGAGELQAIPAVITQAVSLSCSTLLSGAAADAVKSFFRAMPASEIQVSFEDLRAQLLKAAAEALRAAQRSCCECAAAMCEGRPERIQETLRLAISELEKPSTSEPLQCLMLLLLGELGRVSDLSAFPEVEQFIVRALSEGREDVKATASLALGGVAVGNVSQHLPLLLSRIAELDSTSSKQLYLLLKSLNEVLRTLLARSTPMPPGQQEQVLQLLHKCMHVPDECRTMVSDCLAQLTFMSSAAMAKWLQEQLASSAAPSRGVAVAAVKHVMHDGTYAVPELAQHLPEFLQRLEDPYHGVRKEAVLLLGAAAHARPALAGPCLPASLPLLLKLTSVDKSLVRIVDLGPFKQTVDDGLSMRKHTFECLEGLLAKAAFHDKLDMNAIAAAVSQGLGDDKVIKPTAHALICCLCQLSPTSVLTHLKDSMITPLNKTLSQRLKDDAIPQEKERHEEMLRSALTLVKAIASIPQSTTMVPEFKKFLDKTLSNNDLLHVYEKID